MEKTAYLMLENGRVLEGKQFGYEQEAIGELVFTTGMTGYLETLTDQSYYGQMVVQTFPLIGNYGDISADYEGACPAMRAYIVREWCREPSNFRCGGLLDEMLKKYHIPGLYDIDTRSLTRIIRESGVMNAKLCLQKPDTAAVMRELRHYRIQGAVAAVTCNGAKIVPSQGEKRYRVALIDYGMKYNICRELTARRCEVVILPATASARTVRSYQPDGILLSNGPGDPAENTPVIRELAKLSGCGIPIFGVCLGHQLLALAQGARTEKLKYGHRGANHPVRDTDTGRVYITSQNHGYAVCAATLPNGARQRFVNANDNTCEGAEYPEIPAFTVQFHPEACGGPQDTAFLFDRFLAMMEINRQERLGYKR